MYCLALDFLTLITLAFFVGVLLVGYRLAWWLAGASERLIFTLARTGMHNLARRLLVVLIDYDESTYQQSRFIVWNQVAVRFALLWGGSLLITLLIFLFRVKDVVWMPVAGIYIAYRLLTIWLNPPRPPIHTREAELKSLIHDVNERKHEMGRVSTPHLIRQWDYLDELFAGEAR